MLIEIPRGFPGRAWVIYENPAPTFESAVIEQNKAAASGKTARPPGARRQGPDLDGRKGTAQADEEHPPVICGSRRSGGGALWTPPPLAVPLPKRGHDMDNLTHTLVGAVLGRMGLKRLSPRAMPALIVAANLPDIDSFVAPLIRAGSARRPPRLHPRHRRPRRRCLLGSRNRLAWERLRPCKEGPLKLGGLLLVCFLGALSHPLLDFITTYGTRLLEPFSHRWFYGDTFFIVDPWIWIAVDPRPRDVVAGGAAGQGLAAPGDRGRSPRCSPTSASTPRITVRAVARNPAAGRACRATADDRSRRSPARRSGSGRCLARRRCRRTGDYDPFDGPQRARLDPRSFRCASTTRGFQPPRKRDTHVRAFLFWSRMPLVVEQGGRAYLTDQRFFDPRPCRRAAGRSPSRSTIAK